MSENDPKIVFYDGETEPEWWYKNIELVETDKKLVAKEFKIKDLILRTDGIIQIVRKHGSGKQFAKKVPADIVSTEVKDGMRFCPQLGRLLPEADFGNSIVDGTPNAYSNRALNAYHASYNNPTGKRAERKAYIDRRRLEIIRATGCVREEGCDLNQHIDEWDDDYLLSIFEFNHRDGGATKIQRLSQHSWFTDAKAKKHGFKDWKEMWEAEAAKCEVLCKGHHALFGVEHTTEKQSKRQKYS